MNTKRSALALTFALCAFARASRVRAQTPSQTAATVNATNGAREEFHRGQALYERQRYGEALERFRASLAYLPSPNTLLYIGRCQRELARPALAYRAFDEAVRIAGERRVTEPRFEETFRSASEERDALSVRVGFVVLRSLRGASALRGVVVAGESLGTVVADTPIAVNPGSLEVVADFDGQRTRRTLVVQAGATQTWVVGETITASPIETPPPPSTTPTAGWPPIRIVALTGAAVGVAALTASVVIGVVAQGRYDQLARECNGQCPPSRAAEVEDGATLVTATNLLLGAGLTLAVAGGLGFVLAPRGSSTPATAPRMGAAVAPISGGWAIGIHATF